MRAHARFFGVVEDSMFVMFRRLIGSAVQNRFGGAIHRHFGGFIIIKERRRVSLVDLRVVVRDLG